MKSLANKIMKRGCYLLGGVLVIALYFTPVSRGASQSPSTSETVAQTTFVNPLEAGRALQVAARANDEAALARILGPKSKTVLSSGDPVEDKAAGESFAAKYDEMNRWVTMTDGGQVLYIGADNYPFPIPLMKDSSSKWFFNTAAGEGEILARRIGRNELLAIDACSAIANAQEIYFQGAHDGDSKHRYAQQIISTAGKQDGLYWDASQGQDSSPLGNISDFAESWTSKVPSGDSQVLDGYSFRILTGQGADASGGAQSYIVKGQMTRGFAVIASPVQYGVSGIMTFILSRDGVVYQKDLGTKTVHVAALIKEYNPTEGWEQTQ